MKRNGGKECPVPRTNPGSVHKRVVVGISGASGMAYAVRLLRWMRECPEVESHLVMSSSARLTCKLELPDVPLAEITALADVVHKEADVGASIASGSYPTHAMVIVPCSMATLAAVATGLSDNLLRRAADVTLKERRRLIVVARETPLHAVHLRNMLTITELGGIIVPPLPAFYLQPRSVEDVVDHTVGKILDLLELPHTLLQRWGEAPLM